ncbi:hypothetical protein PpBr36_08942 [Pyricularia pennisetigena]|uniref:hypothetical protein n=1 Tax=Pyricularia pennisetigena TaxID=1578925 RepID=UPI001153009E|nr:hypothetical protein PpBr36_08942 [Pyricularia pennisetigena]TLS24361.1 hypothetical protein PpBr36_08942 [Pyricularia pennisetigena]
MTTYVYPNTFNSLTSQLGVSVGTGAAGAITSANDEATTSSKSAKDASFASFICHTAYLETQLQKGDQSAFFAGGGKQIVNRKRIGEGASFLVDRGELQGNNNNNNNNTETNNSQGPKYVALKTAKEPTADDENRGRWRDILFEIRALLHEPLRYHPNIAHLLDIRWDGGGETGSPFPTLVVEYAEFGTLLSLQRSHAQEPLPFSIKQKLCYDVGRGLSILHACGIVHGDLKHENVLIFANRYQSPPGQPYTAKLADFGGTVMDMVDDEGRELQGHRMRAHTFPFEAPEVGRQLSTDGAKKTDAYSYGMLIWRCMLDCADMFLLSGLQLPRGRPEEAEMERLNEYKRSDQVLEWALSTVSEYFLRRRIPASSLQLVMAALMFTLRGAPEQRALDRAQARMRGMTANLGFTYTLVKDEANRRTAENQRYRTPGSHGMTVDTVGYGLGRLGDEYDAQNNMPGYRPDLPHPERGGFHFDPLALRRLLDWDQQTAMLDEFKAAAQGGAQATATSLQPWTAAFFLYQCYIVGFGTHFNAEEACRWLSKAADPPEEIAGVDYLARAWLTRVYSALGVDIPLSPAEQKENLWWSVVRGHRLCSADLRSLAMQYPQEAARQDWLGSLEEAEWNFKTRTGATGMPFFIRRKLSRAWSVDGDMAALDNEIKLELGDQYDSCVRQAAAGENGQEAGDKEEKRFDKIYVNHKGHGLLHLAAAYGSETALRHMLDKYDCSIDLRNQSHSETPLLCAVKAGNPPCVELLLDRGALPDGHKPGSEALVEETPLHWLSSFGESRDEEEYMHRLIDRLQAAGADIEKVTGGGRPEVRGIIADWENSLGIPLTPLGRAVLHQSHAAVRRLLAHGADPLGRSSKTAARSPLELAAVLTLPDMLELLLKAVDERDLDDDVDKPVVWDENEMLEAAHSGAVTGYDPLTLQSRLVRCGSNYKVWLRRTLQILRDRRRHQDAAAGKAVVADSSGGASLCREIKLGNVDIVEALLNLGHPVEGTPGSRPIEAAVLSNNGIAYDMLTTKLSPLSFPENQNNTLLQLFASRPRTAPRDTAIAEHLIASGVSVAPHPQSSLPGALSLAIYRRYFDLADLLIAHGAGPELNSYYTPPGAADTNQVSLLGVLLRQHNFATLDSISYLTRIHGAGKVSLSPLADRTRNTSALHMLCLQPAEEWNSHSQISDCIVQKIIEMFPDGASLGEHAVHPELGSPLKAAVAAANAPMVAALLDSDHVADVDTPELPDRLSPRVLAVRLAQRSMTDFEAALAASRAPPAQALDALKQRFDIAGMLAVPPDQTPPDAPADVVFRHPIEYDAKLRRYELELAAIGAARPADLHLPILEMRSLGLDEQQQQQQQQQQAGVSGGVNDGGGSSNNNNNNAARDPNLPVDLSVLTEEQPTGWHEGVEMTHLMALRVFLKSFRGSESGGLGIGGINALMNQTYNATGAGAAEGN